MIADNSSECSEDIDAGYRLLNGDGSGNACGHGYEDYCGYTKQIDFEEGEGYGNSNVSGNYAGFNGDGCGDGGASGDGFETENGNG